MRDHKAMGLQKSSQFTVSVLFEIETHGIHKDSPRLVPQLALAAGNEDGLVACKLVEIVDVASVDLAVLRGFECILARHEVSRLPVAQPTFNLKHISSVPPMPHM